MARGASILLCGGHVLGIVDASGNLEDKEMIEIVWMCRRPRPA